MSPPNRALLVACVSFACAAGASAGEPLPLHEALAAGKVAVRARGTDASTGDVLVVTLRRRTPEPLVLEVAPGTVFQSASPGVQGMAAARIVGERVGAQDFLGARSVELADDAERVVVVEAYCTDCGRGDPKPSDVLLVAPPGPGLAALLREGLARMASPNAIQLALWQARDGVAPLAPPCAQWMSTWPSGRPGPSP